MYLSVAMNNSGSFTATVYRGNFVEEITAKSIELLAWHVRNLAYLNKEETLFLNNEGVGEDLERYLKQIGVDCVVLRHSCLNLGTEQ